MEEKKNSLPRVFGNSLGGLCPMTPDRYNAQGCVASDRFQIYWNLYNVGKLTFYLDQAYREVGASPHHERSIKATPEPPVHQGNMVQRGFWGPLDWNPMMPASPLRRVVKILQYLTGYFPYGVRAFRFFFHGVHSSIFFAVHCCIFFAVNYSI